MNNYDDIAQLISAFETKTIPEKFTLKGVSFTILPSHNLTEGWLENADKGILAYEADNVPYAETVNLPAWLIFSWNKKIKEIHEGKNTIGSVVPITFLLTEFSSKNPVDAKVDTGASISSLHVDNYHVDEHTNRISFYSPFLSPNKLIMPLDASHLVKSADGGSEPRPVIKLDVEVEGQQLKGVQFNLNDRGQMEQPVLIGSNILEKGNFLINPTLESVELKWELINNIQPKVNVEEVYNMLRSSNVSMSDLIKYMKTHVVESLQTIEY